MSSNFMQTWLNFHIRVEDMCTSSCSIWNWKMKLMQMPKIVILNWAVEAGSENKHVYIQVQKTALVYLTALSLNQNSTEGEFLFN